MKRLITLAMFLPVLAFAGKAEREMMKNEVTPAVKESEAAFSKACGCNLKITIADSIKSMDDMAQAKRVAEDVKSNAAGYCTDADSKKAICKMKSLEIGKTTETKFSMSGSRGVATTDGTSYPTFSMMTQELDK